MNMKKKHIKIAIIAACLALTAAFSFAACSGGAPNESGNCGISSAKLNDRGELILEYSDGRQQNLGAISNKGTTINIDSEEGDVSAATAAGLSSAVSITANFERTYNNPYGGLFPGFGFGGGTSTDTYPAEGSAAWGSRS